MEENNAQIAQTPPPVAKQTKQPKPWLKICLSVVLVIGVVGAAAFWLGKSSSGPNVATPTPTLVPAISEPTLAPDPTANWKTYNNQKQGYSLKYPPDWKLRSDDDLNVFLFSNKEESKSNLTIDISELTEKAGSYIELFEFVTNRFPGGEMAVGADNIEKANYGGYEAVLVESSNARYIYFINPNTGKVIEVNVVYNQNGFAQFQNNFFRIINTIKFLKTTQDAAGVDWKTYKNEKYGFEVKYYPELTPNEYDGGSETIGQFTYLQSILFGTGLGGGNYTKSTYGFEVKVKDKSSLEDFRAEIIGHGADKIDSEKEIVVNNNTWGKINYKIFITTDYIPFTSAVINNNKYSYEITASTLDIDQILSTFKFLN